MSRYLQMILIGLFIFTFGLVAVGCSDGQQAVSTSDVAVITTATTVAPVTTIEAVITTTSIVPVSISVEPTTTTVKKTATTTKKITTTKPQTTSTTIITGRANGLPSLEKFTDRGDFVRVSELIDNEQHFVYGYTWMFPSQYGNVECILATTTFFEDADQLAKVGFATVSGTHLAVHVVSGEDIFSQVDLQQVAEELADYFAN